MMGFRVRFKGGYLNFSNVHFYGSPQLFSYYVSYGVIINVNKITFTKQKSGPTPAGYLFTAARDVSPVASLTTNVLSTLH